MISQSTINFALSRYKISPIKVQDSVVHTFLSVMFLCANFCDNLGGEMFLYIVTVAILVSCYRTVHHLHHKHIQVYYDDLTYLYSK